MEDLSKIKRLVEIKMGLDDISTKSREREYAYARFMYFKLASIVTKQSLKKIGEHCGNRKHCTVIHGIRTFDNLGISFDYYHKYLELLEYFEKSQKIEFNSIDHCESYYIGEISNLKLKHSIELEQIKTGQERQNEIIQRTKELSANDYSDLLFIINNFIKVRIKLNSNVKTLSN